jgi:hypothetical protein
VGRRLMEATFHFPKAEAHLLLPTAAREMSELFRSSTRQCRV